MGCSSVHAIVDIDSEAAAAAHLYGLPAEEFIAARNDLVRRLRAEGERELAAAVALLRRPTVLAAELNRVLRLSPSLVTDLLLCAEALRLDHQRLLEGEPVDVSATLRAHRHCAAELAELANRDHAAIQTALEAASLDEDLHPQLLAATFATEPAPQTGFDLLTPTATVSSLSDARKRRQERRQAEARAEAESQEKTRRRRSQDATTDGPDDPATTDPTAGDDESTRTDDEPAGGGAGDEQPAPTEPGDDGAAAPTKAEIDDARSALRLAERRVDATTASHDKAQRRVEELERQVVAARAHIDDTADRLAAAEAARDRARDRWTALVGDDPCDVDDDG
ncbi:MAG: hypothetical protein AAFN30_17480 [Actinomycetota bacterium]